MIPLKYLSYFNFNEFTKTIPLLILTIFLLVFSAFFSSVETAFSSVNIIRLKGYADEKKRGAKKAVYIAEKFDLTLTTVLVGNNFVNIAATTIMAYVVSLTVINPTLANLISTVLMTVIILVFGEIFPKQYAKENAEKWALKSANIMYFLIKILYPVTIIFVKLKKSLFRKSKYQSMIPFVTEDELESIIDVMEGQGVIEKDDAELIQSALSLNERTVYDIMTPRVDMIAVEVKDSIDSIKNVFFDFQFSRIPVYDTDKDHIIGILSERAFFTSLLKEEEINLHDLISEPYFVSKTTKVDDLIREMQRLKKHFAIVSDEYGGTSGIVTMEDALEELVGEIYDEYDEEETDTQMIIEYEPNKYNLSAEIELEHLFETLKLGETPDVSYSTLGGFVYQLCETLPEENDVVRYNAVYEEHDLENPVFKEYELIFTISKVENRRIREILLEVRELSNKKYKETKQTTDHNDEVDEEKL